MESEPNSGNQTVVVDALSPLPTDTALIIGDAVHNLRAAFDYITTEFIGKSDNRITFPMAKTRDELITSPQFRTVEKAVAPLAKFIRDEIRPYQGGDFLLWETGQLDNFDKHKLLIPFVAITELVDARLEDQYDNVVHLTAQVAIGGRITPVKTDTDMQIKDYGKPSADIFFPKGALFEHKPVIPTLLQLAQLSDKAITALETFCFGNVPNPNPVKP